MQVVVCAIIYNDNKVFLARRSKEKSLPGKWEFPGGKVECGESNINALKRELKEELGMLVDVHEKLGNTIHKYDTFKINLIAYKCSFISASFNLKDHDKYEWVSPDNLFKYDMAEADVPLAKLLA